MTDQPGVEPTGPETPTPESVVEEALAEACAAPPASKANTSELIRVEEMLEIASDAAKRAISLRRKRRETRARAREAGAEMGAAEAAASGGASHRTFTDARGVRWDVFAVYPEARPSPHSQLRGTYHEGWLCFDSAAEKRRLSPVPENWQALGDNELRGLLDRAERARARGSSEK